MENRKLRIACLCTLFLMKSSVNAAGITSMPGSKIQTIDVDKLGEYFGKCDIATIKHIAETLTDKQLSELSLACKDLSYILKPLLNERNLVKYWSGNIVSRELAAGLYWLSVFDISPDGKTIAIAAADKGTISLKNVKTGVTLKELAIPTGISGLKFSDDGKFLVAKFMNFTVSIVDIEKAKVIKTIEFNGHVEIAALTAGGTLFIAAHDMFRELRLWKIPKEGEQELNVQKQRVTDFAISADTSIIVTSIHDFVRLDNLRNSKIDVTPKKGFHIPHMLRISSNNEMVAFTDALENIFLWDTKNKVIKEINVEKFSKGGLKSLSSMEFSHNSKLLATGFTNGSIRIWDVRTQQLIKQLEGGSEIIRELRFSQDDRMLISGSNDGTVKLWQAEQ